MTNHTQTITLTMSDTYTGSVTKASLCRSTIDALEMHDFLRTGLIALGWHENTVKEIMGIDDDN